VWAAVRVNQTDGVLRSADGLGTPIHSGLYYAHVGMSDLYALDGAGVSIYESIHLKFNDSSEFYAPIESMFRYPNGTVRVYLGGGWEMTLNKDGLQLYDSKGVLAKEITVVPAEERRLQSTSGSTGGTKALGCALTGCGSARVGLNARYRNSRPWLPAVPDDEAYLPLPLAQANVLDSYYAFGTGGSNAQVPCENLYYYNTHTAQCKRAPRGRSRVDAGYTLRDKYRNDVQGIGVIPLRYGFW